MQLQVSCCNLLSAEGLPFGSPKNLRDKSANECIFYAWLDCYQAFAPMIIHQSSHLLTVLMATLSMYMKIRSTAALIIKQKIFMTGVSGLSRYLAHEAAGMS